MMKEKYTKPAFALELFTLSSNVAAGCGWSEEASIAGSPNNASKSSCGWVIHGVYIVWTDANSSCEEKAGEDDEVGGYCYHYPSGATSIFGSN